MPVFQAMGETIEGEKSFVSVRKLVPKGLMKHPIYKKTMFYYKGDRNCSAIVLEAGVVPHEKSLRDATAHYHRNVGDELNADAITLYIDSNRPLKPELKHVSHRHEAMVLNIPKQMIASIAVPLANVIARLGLENKFIEREKEG